MKAPPLRGRSIVRKIPAQQVPHAESGQRSAVAIAKHDGCREIGPSRYLRGDEVAKQLRRSRPQRTQPDLLALAVQTNLFGWVKP